VDCSWIVSNNTNIIIISLTKNPLQLECKEDDSQFAEGVRGVSAIVPEKSGMYAYSYRTYRYYEPIENILLCKNIQQDD